jgi:hypothetical protein
MYTGEFIPKMGAEDRIDCHSWELRLVILNSNNYQSEYSGLLRQAVECGVGRTLTKKGVLIVRTLMLSAIALWQPYYQHK